MTITNYTFFSPNGDDFPVTANADAKLYMMLSSVNYNSVKVRHWQAPLNTALNRVYLNTSVIIGGRYFELTNHSLTMLPNTTNYIHAVIDLSTPLNPVSLTVESSNTSNTTDINNSSGTLKRCIEVVTTNTTGVQTVVIPNDNATFGNLTVNGTMTERTTSVNVTGFYTLTLTLRRTGNIVEMVSSRSAITSASGREQADIGITIPDGYRPIARAVCSLELNSGNTLYNPMILRLDSDGKIYLTNEAFSNTRYAQGYCSWVTNNAFPTSN